MIPENYGPQDGCWNCGHVILRGDEEGPASLYCFYAKDDMSKVTGDFDPYCDWAIAHYVESYCMCDKHEVGR